MTESGSMSEVANLAFWFGLAGFLAGGLLGWLGNRPVLLTCLGLAVAAVGVKAVQAALDHGWGTIQHAIYAGLTLWGIGMALVALAGIKVFRTVRQRRALATREDQP
jgi:hypothetical protein